MQQRLPAVLTDALAVRDVNHLLGWHTFGGLGQLVTGGMPGVILDQVKGTDPAPLIALDPLHNALGFIVVFPRQIIRLQQLQGEGHHVQMLIAGHSPLELLRQGFAVAQPGSAHLPLHLRAGQLARRFRAQRPFGPAGLNLRRKLQMHFPGVAQGKRLDRDTHAAHHALFQAIEQTSNDVVVFVQLAALLAQGTRRTLQRAVRAGGLFLGLVRASHLRGFKGHDLMTGMQTFSHQPRKHRGQHAIQQVHRNVARAYGGCPAAADCCARTRRSHSSRPARISSRSSMISLRPLKRISLPCRMASSASR
ncbi:hypothetical protein D9M71_380920 [compost metagenome]